MCTLSWEFSKDQRVQEVCFSRDEQRKRVPAEPPELREIHGVECLFPRDPAGGGTWMGVNAHGVIVCLLNDYRVPFDYAEGSSYRSRGLLVTDALGKISELQSANQQVRSLVEEADYAPFRLVIFEMGKCICWCWDGKKLRMDDEVQCPVTSSSWESERVEEGRKDMFQKLVIEEGVSLDEYHRHQLEGDAESSVCMSRELTKTVSLTCVRVDYTRGEVSINYGARQGEENGGSAFAMEHRAELRLNK